MTTKSDFIEQASANVEAAACCGQSGSNVPFVSNPASIAASGCGCEPGKPVMTVINPQGLTVSACCGKPVSKDKHSTSCCG